MTDTLPLKPFFWMEIGVFNEWFFCEEYLFPMGAFILLLLKNGDELPSQILFPMIHDSHDALHPLRKMQGHKKQADQAVQSM